jgi:hypothetical protein
MSPERPNAVSGVVSTYATADVVFDQGKTLTLFFQYFYKDQFIPKQGDICHVEYREGNIAGSLRTMPIYLDRAPLVNRIQCNSGSWTDTLSGNQGRLPARKREQ